MDDGFNINDRSTWAWDVSLRFQPGDAYLLDPESANHFYQIVNGVPYQMSCPEGLVFDPTVEPPPVCDWPGDFNHADVYAWAVAHGQVTDQR